MTERYSNTAIALHWLTLALIIANVFLGLSMVPMRFSPQKLQWYQWHKWVGVTVFLVTSLRLAWRVAHAAPPMVPMPAWQQQLARAGHALLYILLLLIPLSGWLYSSATGIQVVYLGLVPLPDLVAKSKPLAEALKQVHVALNLTLGAVVTVHAAAALKHHFGDRDATLARMVPMLAPKKETLG